MNFFTKACPAPNFYELFLFILIDNNMSEDEADNDCVLAEAYKAQEIQYLNNANYLERSSAIGKLEKMFGYLYQQINPDEKQKEVKK